MKKGSKNGIALVLVVTVLFALSIMAVGFVTLTKTERSAAIANTQKFQAKLATFSGIDYALAQLHSSFVKDQWYGALKDAPQDIVLPLWLYRGEDLDVDEEFDFGEDVNGNRKLEGSDCSISSAFAPSFLDGLYDGDKTPSLLGLGFSGKVDIDGNLEASFVLKIEELSSKITLLKKIEVSEQEENLVGTARVLFNLIKEADPGKTFLQIKEEIEGINQAMGERGKFSSQREFLQFLETVDEKLVSTFAKNISIYGWEDQSTVRPPKDKDTIPSLASPQKLQKEWDKGITPELTEPIRYQELELEPRSPININTASKEVLIACLNGLKARVVRSGFVNNGQDRSKLEELAMPQSHLNLYDQATEREFTNRVTGKQEFIEDLKTQHDRIEFVETDSIIAERIASAIKTRREKKPFVSWKDFAEFLRENIENDTITPEQASLIWANANPNSNINKLAPDFPDSYLYQMWSFKDRRDKQLFYRIDKTDLVVYTTEFCFHPTGFFSISALSRVVSAKGKIMAVEESSTVVKMFDILKLNTHEDFEKIRKEDGNIAVYPWQQEKNFEYDGWLSIAPKTEKSQEELEAAFFKDLAQWDKNVKSAPLLDKNPGNSFRDGVYSDVKHTISDTNALIGEKGATNLICFWYKPDWDVNDTWARPHSIIDANIPGQEEDLFQIYNESKLLRSFPDNEGRLTLFVWDKDQNGDIEAPLKLSIILPPGLSRNRWIFFAMFWNRNGLGVQINEKLEQMWRRILQMQVYVFNPETFRGKNSTYDDLLAMTFLADNPDLETGGASLSSIRFCGAELGRWGPLEEIGGGFFSPFFRERTRELLGKQFDKNSEFRKVLFGLEADLNNIKKTGESVFVSESQGNLLTTTSTKKNIPSGQKPVNAELLTQLLNLKDIRIQNIEGVDVQKELQLAQKKLEEYLTSPNGAFIHYNEGTEEILDDEKLQDLMPVDVSFKTPTFQLGGPLKYRDQKDIKNLKGYQDPLLLDAPSNGSYGNLMFFNDLKDREIAKTLAQKIYQQGRYANQDLSYSCTLQLSSPFSSRSGIQIGAVRWSSYLPQDCLDWNEQGTDDPKKGIFRPGEMAIKISIADDATNKVFHESINDKEESLSANVSSDSSTIFRFTLRFLPQDNLPRPIVSGPMVDDVTFTFSTGWQFLEWENPS